MDPLKLVEQPRKPRSVREHSASAEIRVRFLLLSGAVLCFLFLVYHTPALLEETRPDPRFAPCRSIDLSSVPSAAEPDRVAPVPTSPTLKVSIAPVISPVESAQIYDGLVRYLAARLGRSPVMLQGSTYAQVSDDVQYHRCDVALVCSYSFVRAERIFGMQALATPIVEGVDTYHALVLVPASSETASLLDLRGRRFASGTLRSSSGWAYAATWLIDRGEVPEHFFGEHVLTGSHDRALDAVVTGYVDGASVHSQVFDRMVAKDPTIADKVRVVLTSPTFGNPPMVVHPKIDPYLRGQLLEALLTMHQDATGREALSRIGVERFVAPDRAKYDSVRKMADVLEAR